MTTTQPISTDESGMSTMSLPPEPINDNPPLEDEFSDTIKKEAMPPDDKAHFASEEDDGTDAQEGKILPYNMFLRDGAGSW